MSEQKEDPAVLRGEGGKFLPGTKGGPGRQRKRPLRDVVTFEEEGKLWAAHLALAASDSSAREFILRHVGGTPFAAAPELPAITWPEITGVGDILGALNAVLGAQRAGDLDGAGLAFLVDQLLKIAKLYELVELGPAVRELQARVAEMSKAGSLQRV